MTVSATLRASRLVLKIGSSLLVQADGELRGAWLTGLAADIAELHGRGQEIIVVTSGAIALGWRTLGLPRRPVRLEEKQASAAAGQILLARAWADALAGAGLRTAQLLITLDDTEARRRYLNARATVNALLRLRVVPVVNENDTVATTEIRFGDNDRLSARVAVMATAETLVLLSDVDGLYTADPGRHPDALHLPLVETITPEIALMAGGSQSGLGTGGMVSKIEAARIAVRAGCTVLLAKGTVDRPLQALRDGARCTVFAAQTAPSRARKDWIAGSLSVMGSLYVDAGAASALLRGSSLLPAGVTAVDGTFERGDAVLVCGPGGAPIAKGLSSYDAGEARRLAGRRTKEIEAVLGYRGRDVLIHRDDLVLVAS
jgi:glutamate 5-kinase